MAERSTKWYQKTWLIVLLCIFFFPIGIFLIWKSQWRKRTKQWSTALVSVVTIFFFVIGIIFAPPTVKVTSAMAPVTGPNYTLTGTISPVGAAVTVNNKAAEVDGDTFKAPETLKEGDNNFTITITDGSKVTVKHVKLHRYTAAEIAHQKAVAAAAAKKKAAVAAKAKADAAAADKKKKAAAAAAAKKKADAAAAAKKKAADAAAAAAKKKAADAAAAAKKKADAAAKAEAEKEAAAPKTLLDITGSGTKQTQPFTTRDAWAISYAFDCSNFGYSGNFQIYVQNTDGSFNTDAGANDLSMSGSNVDYYYDAGSHYLTINSECAWHVIVKG